MRIALFSHSLLSDWNHGNAHFLRGLVTELVHMGHEVVGYEERDAWSVANLVREHGEGRLCAALQRYPALRVVRYEEQTLDLHRALEQVDLAIVHEWSSPRLVQRLGRFRARSPHLRLLFHDTHHRGISAPKEMSRYDLSAFDGVLAFGDAIREIYVSRGWADHAFTFHEAADVRVFHPLAEIPKEADLVWVGNFGDEERSKELGELLLEPVASLGISARVHGVRYPEETLRALAHCGIEYGGYLPNYETPGVFARHRVTVHVPRRPYARTLPGIPTIRPFEALACGIPLVSAYFEDSEHLFRPGVDYLVARNPVEMREHIASVLADPTLAASLSASGRETILARHTCAHRAAQLIEIARDLGARDETSDWPLQAGGYVK